MTVRQRNNPLHGITLKAMLEQMVDQFGWEGLARDIPINCFLVEPSLASALKYLRKAPRARLKVEQIYLRFTVTTSLPSRSGGGSRSLARPVMRR